MVTYYLRRTPGRFMVVEVIEVAEFLESQEITIR